MRNPWLALNVSTNPTARARELRLARELFLEADDPPAHVRAPIADSWRRSAAAGLDPATRMAPIELAEDDAAELLQEHPLGRLAPLLRQAVGGIAVDAEHLIGLTDADGLLLSVDGDPRIRLEAAERVGFAAGARFSEPAAGTNAIGTALAAGHPVQVFACEHFCEHSQWWTCVAAPVRDPATGHILGTIDLTARMETAHPHSLGLVMTAAAMFESSLRAAKVDLGPPTVTPPSRPAAHRPVLTIDALGADRADVTVDGHNAALSLRHSEILVLLAAHPGGLTADELAILLYGDFGKPVTVRAEISRLRRVLRRGIETEPYRLDGVVRCDLTAVQDLLRAGRPADAAARYRGPLLARSEAPGVVALRRELEGWLRRSLLVSEDVEGLWSWLTTASGDDDLQSWRRFLANVTPEDGRRGLAATRLEHLRPAFA
jgi:GAF domain-containing protein